MGNGGAGLIYGVFKLGGMDDGWGSSAWEENNGIVGSLSQAFPHIQAWNDLSREQDAQWRMKEWAVHPGLENTELLAIENDNNHVRQTDYEFLISQEAKAIIQEEGIILLDFREMQFIWNKVSGE